MFLLSETVKQPSVSILAIPRHLSFVIKHGSGLRNKSERANRRLEKSPCFLSVPCGGDKPILATNLYFFINMKVQ